MKIILLAIAVILFNHGGSAQVQRKTNSTYKGDSLPAPGSMGSVEKKKPGKQNKAALKELNLSKKQQQELKVLKQDSKAKRDSIANDTTLSEAQRREKLTILRNQTAAGLQGVLTPEQQLKWKALREKDRQDKKMKKPLTVKSGLE